MPSFVDKARFGSVPVPVGHNTTYSIGVPDVPASGSNLVLKATASGGKTTLKWE